jgi:hypothetical protein
MKRARFRTWREAADPRRSVASRDDAGRPISVENDPAAAFCRSRLDEQLDCSAPERGGFTEPY